MQSTDALDTGLVQQGDRPTPIPEPGIFVGREQLLKQIEVFFKGRTERVFLLEGTGGIGKTTFAAYACRVFRKHFQDVYWGICTDNTTGEQALGELLGLFSHKGKIPERGRNTSSCSLLSQIQALLQKLETHRYLLVFDDFHALLDHDGRIKNPDFELLFQELIHGGHQSKLLIVSSKSIIFHHQPADICIRKRLEGLTTFATSSLLIQLGMNLDEDQLKALHQKVDGHPLALRVLAALYDRGLTIDKLLAIPFRKLSRESQELFDSLFAELWKMLSAEEKEVLGGLATYRIPVPFEAIHAFQVDAEQVEDETARAHLQNVVQLLGEHCLVMVKRHEHDTYTYTVPHILREFISKGLTKTQYSRYHSTALKYLTSRTWKDHALKFEALRDREEARYHALQAGEDEQSIQLGLSLSERLCRCGLCNRAKDILLETMKMVLSEADLATVYNNLGNVYISQGDCLQALEYYDQARKIYEALGLEESKAISYNNLGAIFVFQGEFAEALTYYHKAHMILEHLQLWPDLATSYHNIGFVYASLGKYGEALQYHQQAREIQECLGLDVDVASSYTHIGFIYHSQKSYPLALEYYDRARKIRERLGLELDLAESYNNIGHLYAMQHRLDQALGYHHQAQEILERLGLEVNLAVSYNNIALVYTAQGHPASALRYYKQAQEIQERLGLQADLARTYNNIGCTYAAGEHPEQALWYYERARDIQARLELEAHLAITLENSGQLYYEQGDYRKAEESFSLALKIREKFQHPEIEGDRAFLTHIHSCLKKRRERFREWAKEILNKFKETILNNSLVPS
jgi:tetratricopeptide (TPR) repeat protein